MTWSTCTYPRFGPAGGRETRLYDSSHTVICLWFDATHARYVRECLLVYVSGAGAIGMWQSRFASRVRTLAAVTTDVASRHAIKSCYV